MSVKANTLVLGVMLRWWRGGTAIHRRYGPYACPDMPR